jgi:hypothetical protein
MRAKQTPPMTGEERRRFVELMESETFPDERLAKAINKKLTSLESDLLRLWLQEEKRIARDNFWNEVKDRIPPGS